MSYWVKMAEKNQGCQRNPNTVCRERSTEKRSLITWAEEIPEL